MSSSVFCPLQMIYYIGIALFGLVFLFNALMWTLFVKSLQKCSSSIEATVTNAASNFFFSVITFFSNKLTLHYLIINLYPNILIFVP